MKIRRVKIVIQLDDDIIEAGVQPDQIISVDVTTSTGQIVENCRVLSVEEAG